MKKNLMILATIVACFGLLTMTGCEETTPNDPNGNEQTDGSDEEGTGNEDGTGEEDGNGEGNEPAIELSILKQWVAEVTVEGMTTTYGIDLGGVHENTVVIGMGGIDSDPNVYLAFDNGYYIKSSTPTDETSGTIVMNYINEDGTYDENDNTITYSGLTENSVTLTISLTYPQPTEATYECSAASDEIKIYTYFEYMSSMMSEE